LKYVDPNKKLSYIEQQFLTLNKLTQYFSAELCSAASANQNMNRTADIVPPNFARVILTLPDNANDYINAVYVNGYKRRDAYIATEIPLSNCREAFWAMVQQSGVKAIVLLNDVSSEDVYWPYEVNSSQKFGKVDVKLVREEHLGFLTKRAFQLNDGLMVKQFHLRSWSSGAKLPRDAQQIVDLLEKVEKYQVESTLSKVVVQCLNGSRACGLYCSASFICDRIKEEHQVDVFLAARTTRTQRPQFIESIDQYNFLYEVARSYLENFEIYANFK
jgi:protein tyrosine phosphatase